MSPLALLRDVLLMSPRRRSLPSSPSTVHGFDLIAISSAIYEQYEQCEKFVIYSATAGHQLLETKNPSKLQRSSPLPCYIGSLTLAAASVSAS
jgi:hypothetical protein